MQLPGYHRCITLWKHIPPNLDMEDKGEGYLFAESLNRGESVYDWYTKVNLFYRYAARHDKE